MTVPQVAPDSPALPVARLVGRLVKWYEAGHRRLPWRETRDPYAIWVSEIMLQQTRVETVIPYFHAFLGRYPDEAALAAASEDDLLKSWEGLGYYRRARNLQAAARRLLERGGWPEDEEGLAALPGVGRSTAGAIASIAFGRPAPILDGNVRRVWSRLTAQASPSPAALWALSETAVSHGEPGAVNQALMELGATVCTPKAPECSRCPVARWCAAKRSGHPGAFPAAAPRRHLPLHEVSVALLWRGGRFLVTRRPDRALLGGLWELPGGKWEAGEDGESAILRELREELGIDAKILRAHPVVRHAYSHFAVRLHPFDCEPAGGQRPRSDLPMRWISEAQIASLAFPRGTQKIFGAVFGRPLSRRAAEASAGYDRKPSPP